MPGLPPRSAGSAGPTETNPALASTRWDAAFWPEVAARSVRSPCRAAASPPAQNRPVLGDEHVERTDAGDLLGQQGTVLVGELRGQHAAASARAPPDPIRIARGTPEYPPAVDWRDHPRVRWVNLNMAASHDPDVYLLPTERRVVRLRRHWSIVAWDAVETALLMAVVAMVSYLVSDGPRLVQNVLWYGGLIVLARFAYILYEWWDEQFVVTDKRFILITGVFTTKVAMMPLTKVTDLTYERNVLGRALGYGTIVVESAGQIQAFRRIEHLPQPERIYDAVSELVFGDKQNQAERFAMTAQQRVGRRRSVLAGRPGAGTSPLI